jgi:hypothetical protein
VAARSSIQVYQAELPLHRTAHKVLLHKIPTVHYNLESQYSNLVLGH